MVATIARTHTGIRTHRVRTPTHALYILTEYTEFQQDRLS
jgi:hypothetical protein